MGAESQMLQFAKEDLNLKKELLEQLENSDADFNQNITKVGHTMDTISNVMQQCVGILGNLAKVLNTTVSFTLILYDMIHFYICKTKEIISITA